MNVYQIVSFGRYRRPLKAVTVSAEGKAEALKKAKENGAFPQGVRGYTISKTANVELPVLTLDFCAREIVAKNSIRIGKSVIAWCYDGTVSIVDWNGNEKWFPKLTIEALQYFIDVQPV